MKLLTSLLFLIILNTSNKVYSQTQTIHVFVALCDNINQGIVPVPDMIGNGQDARNNMYWGALYGVKTHFKKQKQDWTPVKIIKSTDPTILDQIVFKHKSKDIYLLAQAYDGKFIKKCTEEFLKASNGQKPLAINVNGKTISFGGNSDLVVYVGHDGLMEFEVDIKYNTKVNHKIDTMILACASQGYFEDEIIKSKANPVLWTTNLMAPEAYTLKGAIDGWIKNETGKQIKERAAQQYNKYQKCGINGARGLFATGFD